VLAKLPKSQQPKAKRALQEIWMAETKAAAELAFDAFIVKAPSLPCATARSDQRDACPERRSPWCQSAFKFDGGSILQTMT
jgi:hypothetical protein